MSEGLTEDIVGVVQRHDQAAARSQQVEIGPSEMGIGCDRFLAYKLLTFTPVNVGRDNWLAIIGTAVHSWLASAFEADNQRLGRQRWVVEARVHLTDGLTGHCDLYDTDTLTVIDHKIVGSTTLKEIKGGHLPPKYRTQLHAYGYAHTRADRKVQRVALACYPRNDTLTGDYSGNGLHIHTETYQERVATDALARIAEVTNTALVLNVEDHPERLSLIPATPDEGCRYCQFYAPSVTPAGAEGCPGITTTGLPTTIPGLTT